VADAQASPMRSYGCSLGCGNPYDFIVIMVQGAETQLLCTTCFITTAGNMLEAMTNPDNPIVRQMMAEAGAVSDQVPFDGTVRKRGHEAPAEVDDPDAIAAFESFVLEDELPDEFR